MTFVQLQNAVMDRLNLTSTEARTRVKALLNLRNAEVCSSIGLEKSRRTTTTANTVANTQALTFSSVANVFSIFDAVYLMKPLVEITLAELRALDPDASTTGYPDRYAILSHGASSVTVLLYPKPSGVSALSADVLALTTTLSADGDVPTFPENFHDVLVHGALNDELMKMEKMASLAQAEERRFEKRLGELRYFLAKRAYLSRQSTDQYPGLGERPAPIGIAP